MGGLRHRDGRLNPEATLAPFLGAGISRELSKPPPLKNKRPSGEGRLVLIYGSVGSVVGIMRTIELYARYEGESFIEPREAVSKAFKSHRSSTSLN